MSDYKEKILAWLDKKWLKEKRNCEICGENKWTLSPDLITPAIFERNTVNLGKTCPQFLLVCNNCGNIKYFSAVFTQLLDHKEDKNGE